MSFKKLYIHNLYIVPLASAANILLNPWWAIASTLLHEVPWKRRLWSTCPPYFRLRTSKNEQCLEYSLGFWIRWRLKIETLLLSIVASNSFITFWYSKECLATLNMWQVFSWPCSTGWGCHVAGYSVKTNCECNKYFLLCIQYLVHVCNHLCCKRMHLTM